MLYTAPLKGLSALEAKNALQRIIHDNDLDIPISGIMEFISSEILKVKGLNTSFRTWKTMVKSN
jgi:hypothetical protein